jgi:hypothetical protein
LTAVDQVRHPIDERSCWPSLVDTREASRPILRRRKIGELAVSLNHKRRIFRPGPGILPHFGVGLPSPRVWLAAACGVASLLAAAWLLVRPSDAPARPPAGQRLLVPADRSEVIDGNTLLVGDHLVRLRVSRPLPSAPPAKPPPMQAEIAASWQRTPWPHWCGAPPWIASLMAVVRPTARWLTVGPPG